MRKLVTAWLILAIPCIGISQKELPAFGKIDKNDLLMKECDIDPDAVAYRLFDFGDVYYQPVGGSFQVVKERRIRLKILKDKGIDFANIKISFYSEYNENYVSNISGITYNLDKDGNIVTTKLDKSSIFKKTIDKQRSEVAFTMPDAKVGSVIEYKFKESSNDFFYLPDWYFQSLMPTRISIYRIEVPSIFRFTSQLMTYQQVEQKKDYGRMLTLPLGGYRPVTFDTYLNTYILKNVPAIPDEPYMSSPQDYLQRVIFQLSELVFPDGEVRDVANSWQKISRNLLENEGFGQQLKKNIPHTRSLDDSARLMKNDYDRMVFIYDFVKRNMNWNGYESIGSDNGIKSAWDKKSGSTSEINFILIDLLRDADIKAYPLLVSTRDNGAVNPLYPFLMQFNCTIALAVIGDKKYALNAADKYNPAWLIPFDVLNNQAFIVDEQEGRWIDLTDDKDLYENTVSIFSEITNDGLMKGQATVYSAGYCKNARVKKWTEDKKEFDQYFSKAYTGVKVEDLEVDNADVDTLPLVQKVNFSLPVSVSGEYEHFPLNLFQGLEKNPFVADKRTTDIDFGYKQSYLLVGTVNLPEEYEFDELPKNIRMIMPDTSIVLERMMQADSSSLQFRIKLNFLKDFYVAGDYQYFKEFYKKLFETLNEEVVIKKKKGTP